MSSPSVSLDEVVPLRGLEQLELPPPPLRVASRPKLDWQPGLEKAEEKLPADELQAPTLKPTPDDALKPVEEPPQLIAPKQAEKPLPKEAPQEEPPEKAPLPLQSPRNAETEPEKVTEEPTLEPTPRDQAKEPSSIQQPEPQPKDRVESKEPNPAADQEQTQKPKKDKQPQLAKPLAVAPAKPQQPLSRSMRNLRSRLRTVLSFYYNKPLNTQQHDPWEVMHSMLSYELHSRIRDGGPKGAYLTAIGHLCFNRPTGRQRMMVLNNAGEIDAQVGVGLQGHRGQLLAMLAQCNVSPEYPIRVQNKEFTIVDLIAAEQKTCYSKTELTFKLIGLGHYLDSNAAWLNDRGERWDIPRLIREEREQPIRGAACGGTHRLAGLSLACRRREARGEPLDGEYAEAAKFVQQYHSYAFRLQNQDGSLSTEWFRGRGDEEDIDRRLRTSGHTLEWLVYSLPEDELRSYKTVRAVNYLVSLLAGNADHEWHLGSIAHGLHALVLYDKRVFRPYDETPEDAVAAVDPTKNRFRDYPIYRGVMRNSPPEPRNLLDGLFGSPRTGSAASRRR